MSETKITAEVSGSVWKVLVKVGDAVQEGDEIIVIESMKMEIPVHAPQAGAVRALAVKEGEQIQENQLLATIG